MLIVLVTLASIQVSSVKIYSSKVDQKGDTGHIPVGQIMKKYRNFDEDLFTELLTSKANSASPEHKAILFHSDMEKLLKSLHHEFYPIVQVESIGKSYEGRDILLMTVDARDYMQKMFKKQTLGQFTGVKPSILLTGQIHSREAITSMMGLYSVLKLLHQGYMWQDQHS